MYTHMQARRHGDHTIWILVVGGVVALALIALTVSSFVLYRKAKGKK